MKSLNINAAVYVKLTELGLKILEDRHNLLYKIYSPWSDKEWVPPEVDEDGYSRFQLWELFESFGKDIYHGCKMPFWGNIKIDEKDLIDA